jgi:hypothetical protein
MFSLLMSAILMLVAITLSAGDGDASAAPESAEPGGTCGGGLARPRVINGLITFSAYVLNAPRSWVTR